MNKLTFIIPLLLVLMWPVPDNCVARQRATEGYIRTADGVRLFYMIVGSGTETLVVVHGGPGNTLESIRPDLEPLAKNRRIIYYDQRGNGRSELLRDANRLAISKQVADLEAVRAYFKLDKMTLLGNSWGGLLIAYYAVAHPDRVERMILHSPAEPAKTFAVEAVEEIQQRIDQRYDAAQRKRFGVVADPQTWLKASDPQAICREFFQLLLPVYVSKPENVKLLKGDVCAGSEEAVRSQQLVNTQIINSLGDWNLLPSLGVVKAPVLVIHGAADPIPIESSEAWAHAFPNARLLLIRGAGHLSQVEQPEIFFSAVETFLRGSFPAQARQVQAPTEGK